MTEQRKPHPNAHVIKAWVDRIPIQSRAELRDGYGDWVDWYADDFVNTPPFERQNLEWRIKPRMAQINGIEFPAPETEAPPIGTQYWLPCWGGDGCLSETTTWDGYEIDHRILKRGHLHLTREAAEQHARAEILAVGGEV